MDKYTWVDLGSSYLPSDILAAILLAQLEKREEIQAIRLCLLLPTNHVRDSLMMVPGDALRHS